ncbi:MAG TPA: hypothetical protein VGM82_03515 [Gemmatimonadaceae bacterium]|jgi:hypothetical protein
MPLPADYPAFESAEAKLLFECKLEIEELWMSGEDRRAVHRLARAHPTLGKELYFFFADMLEIHVPEIRRAPSASSEVRLDRPFLAVLRDVADESVQEIAASMDITPDFLVDLSDHGRAVTLEARRELVRRASVGRAIDEAEAVASFDVVTLRRAASRDTEFHESNETFADLVTRSSLSAEQKRFWSNL